MLLPCPLRDSVVAADALNVNSDTAIASVREYRSRKPLIVTTNLTLDALKHPDDLAHARIYDRILEICAPILFGGENLRVEKANEMKTAARNLLLPGNAA